MPTTEIVNYSHLTETLATGGQPTEAQLTEAAQDGVNVVINLALSTSDNALPDEAATVRGLGMEYIHIPVEWSAPQPADLERFLDAMDAHSQQKILVHCALNFRASAFTALWRVLRQGWDTEQAFAPQRAIWSLDEYPVWKDFVEKALANR